MVTKAATAAISEASRRRNSKSCSSRSRSSKTSGGTERVAAKPAEEAKASQQKEQKELQQHKQKKQQQASRRNSKNCSNTSRSSSRSRSNTLNINSVVSGAPPAVTTDEDVRTYRPPASQCCQPGITPCDTRTQTCWQYCHLTTHTNTNFHAVLLPILATLCHFLLKYYGFPSITST